MINNAYNYNLKLCIGAVKPLKDYLHDILIVCRIEHILYGGNNAWKIKFYLSK